MISYFDFFRCVLKVFILSILVSPVMAQQDTRGEVLNKIQKIADLYRSTELLSFNVKYVYSTEENRAVPLDSLSGSFKLNGSHYWYSLDNTEALINDDLMITLFKEDKIIYLSNPPGSHSANPVAMLDSALMFNQYSSFGITTINDQEKISIDFKPGMPYRRIEYYIDTKTGFLSKMINVVAAEQMYDPEVKSMLEKDNQFGIIEVTFSNHRKGGASANDFSSEKYIRKEGKEYRPSESYNSYKIFLGSPNL